MRVLVTVSGWAAHYFQLVPVGWALQAAGHEVRVACPPGQAAPLAAAGLTPVPILGDLDMTYLSRFANLWSASQGGWTYGFPPLHPETGEPVDVSTLDFGPVAEAGKRRIAGESRRGYDAAVAFAREWRPDLVLYDRLSAEGLLAARVTGVPALVSLCGIVGTAEPDPALYAVPVDYTGTFPRYGVPPLSAQLMDRVLDCSPAALAPPVAGERWPVRYVPYNGTGADPGLPAPERPRVCVVWSNSMSRMYGRPAYLVPLVVSALAGLDVEVVVLAHREDAPALAGTSERVRVLTQAPLHAVLPGCAAVVHHGGAGSAMTALAAGVPQVTLSFGPEWNAIGGRVAGAGAGVHLAAHLADAESVRAAVTDVLDKPAYRQAAGELAEQVRQAPSPADVAQRLESLAAR